MESDQYICVRETVDNKTQVHVFSMLDYSTIMKRPITADSTIMHPTSQILALKAGRQLQIFNTEMKARIKSHTMNDDIIFWKWINNDMLGLVSESCVYHWQLEGGDAASPVKVFDRGANLSGCQIVNYRVSSDLKWMLLMGIHQKDGRIAGALQLYSKDKASSQAIEGHAGSFAQLMIEGCETPVKVFVFAGRTATASKLHMVEIDHPDGVPVVFVKRAVDLFFPAEMPNDFPVALQISSKYNVAFIITKHGFLHIYHLETGACIYMNRITTETMFVTAPYTATDGIIGVNRKGEVLSISIDDDTIIPYLRNSLNNQELAYKMAVHNALPGADDLVRDRFAKLMSNNQAMEAAKLAANSPGGILRTQATIDALKAIVVPRGQLSPILQYFGILLEKSSLNAFESVELVKPVLAQGRKQLLEKWLAEGKLECSEELGDITKPLDATLALSIYLKATVSHKVVQCFAETGQYDKIPVYAQRVGFQVDYLNIFEDVVRANPEASVTFAKALLANNSMSLDDVIKVYEGMTALVPLTSLLLEVLKQDKPEEGRYQTKLLELNLINGAPQVAGAILSKNLFSHYDKAKIGKLCETHGLLTFALENQTDPFTIRRLVVQNTATLDLDWLLEFFRSKCNLETTKEILEEMASPTYLRQNLTVLVKLLTALCKHLSIRWCIEFFEKRTKSFDGLYFFLKGVTPFLADEPVEVQSLAETRLIQAAVKSNQLSDLEKLCRENNHYDAQETFTMIKDAKLADCMPLLYVADKHPSLIPELVQYLLQHHKEDVLALYVQKMNPQRMAPVIACLLDDQIEESFIKRLLKDAPPTVGIDELLEVMESRGKLRWILPWLEKQLSTMSPSSSTAGVYNALAKIYVDTQHPNTEEFLRENMLYNRKSVGKYCEKKNAYKLAFLAYSRGDVKFHDDVIRICWEAPLYKELGSYLMSSKDLSLWDQVLNDYTREGHQKSAFVDSLLQILPGWTDAEGISVAVKAFMNSSSFSGDFLLKLLESILFNGDSLFCHNTNLQNLLLLTGMKMAPSKVPEYVKRLDAFSITDMALLAYEEYKLYEVAFLMYDKGEQFENAIEMLLLLEKENMQNEANEPVDAHSYFIRSRQYARDHPEPAVLRLLALEFASIGQIKESVELLLLDPTGISELALYTKILNYGFLYSAYEEMIKFLKACQRDANSASGGPASAALSKIDNELGYCYCKLDRLKELEELLASGNVNPVYIGDKCLEESLWKAAKICFSVSGGKKGATGLSGHPSKMAMALIGLGDLEEAFRVAQKANSSKVYRWLLKGIFVTSNSGSSSPAASSPSFNATLAQMVSLAFLGIKEQEQEDLENNIRYISNLYLFYGLVEPLIKTLQLACLSLGSSSSLLLETLRIIAMYTTDEEQFLLEFIKLYGKKIPFSPRSSLKYLEENKCWKSLFSFHLLHMNDETSNAQVAESFVGLMLKHSALLFDHDNVKISLLKLPTMLPGGHPLLYKTMYFYLEEHPLLIPDLLSFLKDNKKEELDPSKVIEVFRNLGHLQLVRSFLAEHPYNEANLDLLVEEGDWQNLSKIVLNSSSSSNSSSGIGAGVHSSVVSAGSGANPFNIKDSFVSKLSLHECIEFRRIAAVIAAFSQHRYSHAIDIALKDLLFKEAIMIAGDSNSAALVYELSTWFCENSLPEQFFITLTYAFHIISDVSPDGEDFFMKIISLAWKYNYMDLINPILGARYHEQELKLKMLQDEVQSLRDSLLSVQQKVPVSAFSHQVQQGLLAAGSDPSRLYLTQ